MILYVIALALVTLASSAWGQWIEQVRLARADFDGDGVADVVAGGRIGPFVSADTPIERRRARVEILDGAVSIGRPLASTSDLNVVSDVAAGDLDGDGELEIVVVGGGRLTVLRKRGTILYTVVALYPGNVTQRVAILEGARQRLVAMTDYMLEGDGDSGHTIVRLYGFEKDRLDVRGQIDVRGHIGDLTFFDLGGARVGLVAETGGGEEGGDAVVWDVSVPAQPHAIWEGHVINGRRTLAVSSMVNSPGVVAFGGLDGTISVCEWAGGHFTVRDKVRVGPVADLVALSSSRWLVSSRSGGRPLQPIDIPR